MSERVMIDQIAFDEAEERVVESLAITAKPLGWTEDTLNAEIKCARGLIALMRLIIFDTEHSLITQQGGQRYEQ